MSDERSRRFAKRSDRVVAFVWLKRRLDAETRAKHRAHLLDEMTLLWRQMNRLERLEVRAIVPEGVDL